MPYLADTLAPAPIVVKGEIFSPYIIAVIMIVVFIIFATWVIWIVTVQATQPSGSSSIGAQLLLACAQGECGTNMQSGEKRCPISNTDVVLIDPSAEVCNPPFLCTSFETPYALLADGSTNEFGVCNSEVTCRCLKNSQCATYITSVFVVLNGSLYGQISDNRFLFSQVPVRDDIGVENIQFEQPAVNFCGIKTSSLNRIAPGACNFTDSDYQNPEATLKIATDCVNSNPCVKGTMVFNTTTPAALQGNGVSTTDVLNIPVTCVDFSPSQDVSGTPYPDGVCNPGTVPYYDGRYNLVFCANINYTLYS
jgi:hypothetical protein